MTDTKIIYKIILTLFLVYEAAIYFKTSKVIFILIDKSFGDKTELNSKSNIRKAVMKTWFFALFVISYIITFYTLKSYSKEDYPYFNEEQINGLFYIIGVIFMLLFHFYPIKVVKSDYYRDIEIISTYEKFLNELQASSIKNDDLISKEFYFALKMNYFVCELSQFKELLQLKEPTERIVWKPVVKTKKKDRQLLLTFLNKLFQNQLVKIERKEVCLFVNKYFEFNEFGHDIKENPLKPDNIGAWIKNI